MREIAEHSKDSDEDSISLTSTLESEPQEEYPLDRILAERNNDGVMEYLVKWQNYPDERCTWEAETNFRNDSTIPEWETIKTRIKKGIEEPYNVDALEARVQAWIDATKKRKSRRRAKRLRLGLPVTPSLPDDSSDSSSKFEEDDDGPNDSPPLASHRSQEMRKRNFSGRVDVETDEEDSLFIRQKVVRNRNNSRKPSHQKRESSRSADSVDGRGKEDARTNGERSSTEDSLMEALRNDQSSRSHNGKRQLPKNIEEVRATTTEKRNTKGPISQSATTHSIQTIRPLPKPNEVAVRGTIREASKVKPSLMGKVGRGPARFGLKSAPLLNKPRISGPAILKNWNKGPGPRRGLPSQAEVFKKGDAKSKPFEKLSTRRRLLKAGRNEPAPNIEHLILMNPKHGLAPQKSSISSSANVIPSKSPFQMYQESRGKTKVSSPVEAPLTSSSKRPGELPSAKPFKTEDVNLPTDMDMDVSIPPPEDLNAKAVTELPKAIKEEHLQEPQTAKLDYYFQGTRPRNQPETPFFIFDSSVHRYAPFAPRVFAQPMTIAQIEGDAGMQQGPGYPQAGSNYEGKSVEDFSDIFGTITSGPEHIKVGEVKFRGLAKPVKKLLLSIKIPPKTVDLWFRQMCTAADYKLYFHENRPLYHGAGHVVPWPQTVGPADAMAETLRMHDSAGVFSSPDFSMIVYPTGSESWRFFDERFPLHSPKVALRFIIRTAIQESASIYQPTVLPDLALLIMENESGASALFRECYGIDFQNLLPQNRNKSEQLNTFFLMYSPTAQEEHDLLVKFLAVNNATIYSWQTHGAWDYFSNNVLAGVVLIHESFIPIHLIPSLSRVLLKSINFFSVTLQPILPNPYLTRLFPHGCALLLTDSLILNNPQSAARILKWFHSHILNTKPIGTWKLAMRPRIRDWILTIIEDRSKAEGCIFVEIYAIIYKLLPMGLMDESDNFETPMEDAPVVCASELSRFDLDAGLGVKFDDQEVMKTNDARLVEWFAGWARTKFEYIRRFQVVYGEPDGSEEMRKQWGRRWTHLTILAPEECLRFHSTAEWESKEKREEEKRTDRKRKLSLSLSVGGRERG